jgi:competence protein ComGE
MWRNCKGFSLLEVMTGFAVLILSILVFSPLLEQLYKERQTVQQHYLVLSLLHNLLEEHITAVSMELQTKEAKVKSTTFYITSSFQKNNGTNNYCVEWIGANKRDYRKCVQVK